MNYSKFLSLINGVSRTVDLSNSSNVLELGGNLQMDSSTAHVIFSATNVVTSYQLNWPVSQASSAGYVLSNDGTGNLSWVSASSGSVTSVGLSLPSSVFDVTVSPITSSGDLTATFQTESANSVFAGPSSGSSAAPTFRSLVAADIPSLSSIYLPLAGGTMSGAINMGGNQINDVGAPSAASDAATKGYVDAAINGLDWQPTVQAFADSNVPLTGGATLTIDSYSVQNGDRVILSNQTTPSENGTYVASGIGTAYSLTATSVAPAVGFAYLVLNGTVYADTGWVVSSLSPTIFVQFSSAGEYSFNAPLSASGTSISLDYGNGLTLSSGNLIANLGNGLEFSGAAIAVEAADSSISVASGGISVAEDAAGAIVTGGSGIKIQLEASDPSLQISSNALGIKFNAAGALASGASGVAVQVDGSTIDINGSNELEVKAAGITSTQLASASVTAAKLGTITDGSTLDQSGAGSTLEIKAGGVGTTQLASASVTAAKLGSVTDGVTLDQSGAGSTLEIKSGGVTETQINSSALSSTGALAGGSGTKLSVKVDGSTIDINGSDELEVKAAGISATQLATGAFDQVTIMGGAGTPAYVAYAPAVEISALYGGAASLAANTTYAMRWGIPANSETAGQLYVADWDTSSYDEFWCVGLYNSTSSTATGASITVMNRGSFALGSSDTNFGSSDQGMSVWLGSAGAFSPASSFSPSSGDASFKLGIAQSASSIFVDMQMMGVN